MKKITGIITTVGEWDFSKALVNDFSGEAAEVLYEFYMNLSEDTGEPIILDTVAIRCDWHEYEDDTDFILDMGLEGVEGIHEEIADLDEGDNYGYHGYRLSNGHLLARTS